MTAQKSPQVSAARMAVVAALELGLAVGAAQAQPDSSSSGSSSGSTSAGSSAPAPASSAGPTAWPGGAGTAMGATVASDPNPYFLGVSQGFTHDSNATRSSGTSGSTSDTYSSTSLFGGFNQPIARQRIYGRGSVSENRYFSQSNLNNTSYNLGAGLDWATIASLAGSVNVALGQNRSAPLVFTPAGSTTPTSNSNLARTQSIDASATWGGAALLSLFATVGHAKVDYSAPENVTSNITQNSASVGFHISPGGPLRLGMALRETRTKTPQAVPLGINGPFESNTSTGKNIDLLVDYRLSGIVNLNARLSRTEQTNSNANLAGADFSGLTGSLNVSYQATGKTSLSAYLSRDTGFNSSLLNTFQVTQVGGITVVSPLVGLYQSNEVTTAVGLNVSYLATAKISANAGVRYARAKLLSSIATASGTQIVPGSTDVGKSIYLGAGWNFARNWGLNCSVAHEVRDVSTQAAYSYTNDSVGCSAQYTWP